MIATTWGGRVADDIQFPDEADNEALRLALAFYCIMEEDKREHVLALAQQYAAEAKRCASDDATSTGIS